VGIANEISVMATLAVGVMNFFAEICNAALMKNATTKKPSFHQFALRLGERC
jgi:hypothetical protein